MQTTVRTIASLICLLIGFISNEVYGNTVSNTNTTTSNAASASPEKYDLDIDGIYYCITSVDNLSVEVVGGENVYSGEIDIPDFVNYRGRQFRVTSIGDTCFLNSSITNITIGSNILTIGKRSFQNCKSLTSVVFSDGTDLLTIKYDFKHGGRYGNERGASFVNCPIQHLYIGRDISPEKGFAFYGLSNASEIIIGPTVTKIHTNIWTGATKINTLKIPASVIYIGFSVFRECDELKSLYFEDGADNLNYNADIGSKPIEYLYIGRNFINYNPYLGSTMINKVDIGPQVTRLISLNDLSNLSEIKIPKNIEEIGSFEGCYNLRNIYCMNDNPPISDYDNVFDDVVFAMATLYVPKGRVETYQSAKIWKKFFEIKEFDENAASPTISVDENVGVVGIFDINGRRLSHTQNGLNIVKYSNGTVKKIVL